MKKKYLEAIKKWVVVIIGTILGTILGILACGIFVHMLWNLLVPKIFGLSLITYWESVGLLTLSSLLFKITANRG